MKILDTYYYYWF